jgi:hypothetical protein
MVWIGNTAPNIEKSGLGFLSALFLQGSTLIAVLFLDLRLFVPVPILKDITWVILELKSWHSI